MEKEFEEWVTVRLVREMKQKHKLSEREAWETVEYRLNSLCPREIIKLVSIYLRDNRP